MSIWRYLFILVLVSLGLVYAAPNLPQYGDDYAVQVSPTNATIMPENMAATLKQALDTQHIPFLSIRKQPHAYLIRFQENAEQTQAQEVLQATFGEHYSVALNLAPKTPAWLKALGAAPMKLGLDLRGGIHFLLNVDVAVMVAQHEQSDRGAISAYLREEGIRYQGIERDKKTGIRITFNRKSDLVKAKHDLYSRYAGYKFIDRAASGRFEIVMKLKPQTIAQLEQDAVKQNIRILENRVNDLGVAEPVIMQQGRTHISIDLPGIQDTARAKAMMGNMATLRWQLVDTDHDAVAADQGGMVPFGSTLYHFEGRPLLVKNTILLTGRAISNAASIMAEDGGAAVSVQAAGSDVPMFNRVTGENVGNPMAVIYLEKKPIKRMINGKVVTEHKEVVRVINVARIESALGNRFQITGLGSPQYAKDLALQLRSGAYAAPVDFVQERVVGPGLGKQNIRLGVFSCAVGSLLVILFMALYYRLFGLMANLALVLNVVFVVAVMSILHFTLTLPGIAAIVLTVGMAVDANVLINERIREELRLGVSPIASIRAGYDRAFTTIVDANVTTLIVAIVLFIFGTGAVQGFAVALTIGLLTSMITAIYFTRALVDLVYGRRKVKQLSIGIRV